MMEWVRLYHDMPPDPKWRVIARKSGQRIGDVLAVFCFVLTNASANGADRGRLNNLSPEDVGAALDLEEQDVKDILDAMEGRVIAADRLIAWDARNPKREDDSADRVRRHRVTQRNAGVTQRNAPDKEEDTEKETAAARERAKEAASSEMNRLNKLLGFREGDFQAHAANLRTLIDLKAEGCDFARHILPAAEAAAKSGKARALAYIRPKAHELRNAAVLVASLPPAFENTDERGWRDRLRVFRDKGMWGTTWGPKPNEVGCKCPEDVLREAA